MNNNTYFFILLGIAAFIGIGAFAYVSQNNQTTIPLETNQQTVQQEQTENDSTTVAEDQTNTPTTENTSETTQTGYVAYSPDYLNNYQGKTKVLFFHANWCPTCKAADRDISSKLDQIPDDVVIIKTDYDSETALKKKYGITYQHTFVVVDDKGNEVQKWNGGNLAELLGRI